MLVKSKNLFDVFIDESHLHNHLDPNQPGGTFCFKSLPELLEQIKIWLHEITLPPETFKSFFGDPTPPPGEFVIKTVLQCPETVGWNALFSLKDLPENTKIEWEIRRGFLTKIFPQIAPKPCNTVVLMIARFDQERLNIKIESDIRLGKYRVKEEHPSWKFVQSQTEWVLLTAYPGTLAPLQSDQRFWDAHGFATGALVSQKPQKV